MVQHESFEQPAPAAADVENVRAFDAEELREVVELASLRGLERVVDLVPQRAGVDQLATEPQGEELVGQVVVPADRRR